MSSLINIDHLIYAILLESKINQTTNLSEWINKIDIENLPYEKARIFSNIIYSRKFDELDEIIKNRIIGKTRYTWTNNKSRLFRIFKELPIELKHLDLMLWKGAAVTEIAKNWRTREMGDLDIQVNPKEIEKVIFYLENSNKWRPQGEISWGKLRQKLLPRRESWNFISNNGDILDIHWSYSNENLSKNLINNIFKTSKEVCIFNHKLLIPETEWVIASSIQHGFLKGTLGDKIQSIFDFYNLFPLSNHKKLEKYLKISGVIEEGNLIKELILNKNINSLHSLLTFKLFDYENPPWLREMSKGKVTRFKIRSKSILPKENMDRQNINKFIIYRIWERLGRSSFIEKKIIKKYGFLTKVLDNKIENINDILTIGWQLPDQNEIWSDRADCRLVINSIPLNTKSIKIQLSKNYKISPNPIGFIYINGEIAGAYNLKENLTRDFIQIDLPKNKNYNKIEISFRPDPYVSKKEIKLRNIWQRHSIPIAQGRFEDIIIFI